MELTICLPLRMIILLDSVSNQVLSSYITLVLPFCNCLSRSIFNSFIILSSTITECGSKRFPKSHFKCPVLIQSTGAVLIFFSDGLQTQKLFIWHPHYSLSSFLFYKSKPNAHTHSFAIYASFSCYTF